jgi:Acetyltransferase (GNAT) domain
MTTTAVSTGLTVDVITDSDHFRALEHQWRALYDAAPLATPFQTWEWLYTWWEVYGTPDTLRLVTARDGDRLAGLLPLMITAAGRLEFVGTGLSDHLDALVDPTRSTEVVDAWATGLYRSPGLKLLDLHEVRPEAAIWQLYVRWPGRTRHYRQSRCAEFDVEPLDDMLAKWTKNTRTSARVAMNRMSKNGYRLHWATPDEIGDMAEVLVADHQRMWEGRGITPAHAEPRFARFVRTVCERMAGRDQVALARLEPPDDADDPMRVTALMFVGRQYVGGWLSAENETARRRLSIALVESLFGIEEANRRDLDVVSQLRGLEEGKLRMHDRIKANHRLLLAGHGAGATAAWLGQVTSVAAVAGLKHWEQHSETGQRVTGRLRAARQQLRP